MPSLALKQQTPTHSSNGGRLVTADGRDLPLRGAAIHQPVRRTFAGDLSGAVAG